MGGEVCFTSALAAVVVVEAVTDVGRVAQGLRSGGLSVWANWVGFGWVMKNHRLTFAFSGIGDADAGFTVCVPSCCSCASKGKRAAAGEDTESGPFGQGGRYQGGVGV